MTVVDLEIVNRFPYAAGREFKNIGSFEQVDAEVTLSVDPDAECNLAIVDLKYAPRNPRGQVVFKADFSIVKPVDPSRGTNRLMVELPNRGRRRVVDTFNMSGKDADSSADPGDGFLFERGFTVASIGWQWDVYRDEILMGLEAPFADLANCDNPGKSVVEIRPNQLSSTWLLNDRIHKPVRAADINEQEASLFVSEYEDGPKKIIPRTEWNFAKETPDGVVSNDEYVYMQSGFQPGLCYQVVYTSKDAPVTGAGFIALRDITSCLKYEPELLMTGLAKFESIIGYGTSQTGRMLRQFIHLGLNVDEKKRPVFDGLLPHVAGARMGAFNHRYAQPSNHSYPSFGHLPPFTDIDVHDPISNASRGLLARLEQLNAVPKVIYTNTSAEYWRGDCSLMHTDAHGTQDVPLGKNSRMYHFAGTQHGAGGLPQSHEGAAENAKGRYAYNVLDYTPLLRSALVALESWIESHMNPPPSKHPTLEDGTAVPRGKVLSKFSQLPNQVTPDPDKLWVIRNTDLGDGVDEGFGDYPPVEGDAYTCLVSDVDEDGNEVSGIRLPDLNHPVATHAGWNVRHPDTGSTDQIIPMQGFTRWFPVNSQQQSRNNDSRVAINDRYADRDEYEKLVRQDAELLVSDGYVLQQDLELVVHNALDRYDESLSRSKESL